MGHHQTMEEFRQQTLKTHNSMRAKHGAGPVKMSDDLNSHAQAWAETLVKTELMKHSECMLHGSRIGENIAFRLSLGPQDLTGTEAVMQWYNEVKEHDFDSENFNPKSAHFTQVVWKTTAEIGAGKSRTGDGRKVYVVCNYRPPGNFLGQILTNVTIAQ